MRSDFDRVLARITGTDRGNERRYDEADRQRLIARHVAERQNHKFSDSIGGDSSNYTESKFGPRR